MNPGIVRLFGAFALASASFAQEQEEEWLVRAHWIYTAEGTPIENGHVLVSGGTIKSVAAGGGSGAEALEVAAVTPGMVDLSVRIDTGQYSVEQSTETAIDARVADALDLFSYRWQRELRSGVTSVLASALDNDVFSGLSVLIKTGGEPTLDSRLVKADAALRASLGSQPSNGNQAPRGSPPRTFYYRRPTTRMAVEWLFRKSYFDAIQASESGESSDPRERSRHEILRRTLQGELPVAVQAWATQDIRTAVYLKEEFGIPRMWVDAAAEAWREPDLLVRSGMAVVLPPYPEDGHSGDEAFYALDTAAKLHALGVPVVLSGHGAQDTGERLAYQPGFAQRGGMPFDAALAAVTLVPAKLVGVDDRIGSLSAGKDADLVLWSGTPFEPTSRVVGVILNGHLVVDPRSQ